MLSLRPPRSSKRKEEWKLERNFSFFLFEGEEAAKSVHEPSLKPYCSCIARRMVLSQAPGILVPAGPP